MDTILIVGLETVVGANAALHFASSHRVVGLAHGASVTLQGVERRTGDCRSAEDARRHVDDVRPRRVLYCGSASISSWDPECPAPGAAEVGVVRGWAEACAAAGAQFTYISSDALFTGPWMFHDEQSESRCPSVEAGRLAAMEEAAAASDPSTLIIRTNAFGWAPGSGWIDTTLAALHSGRSGHLDCVRHGTPILAADLAAIIERAWRAELSGVFHAGGADRINPAEFARRLSREFVLPEPRSLATARLAERSTGYARGESSLVSRALCRALQSAPPTIAEGLTRLREETTSGVRDQLQPATRRARVA